MKPSVSIIVPCYNEQDTIRKLLEAVYAQDYPRGQLEVVIADGNSSDCTRDQIAVFQAEKPDLAVRVVNNPRRTIPAALNRAIEAAEGEWIVRLDGHSEPSPDYVSRCVAALMGGQGDNVGGLWDIRPASSAWQARSIAAAAAHPLGVGDARYRIGGLAQEIDTVPFGAFRRDLIDRVGPFDETLLTNEDYEFNARIRRAGGRVWLDPSIRSVYFARATFFALARQYWRYGYWKARMLRRYPGTLRWRQFLPPAFVLCLAVLLFLAFFFPPARLLLALLAGFYGLALLLAGLQAAMKKGDPGLVVGLPLAIGIMHFTWGSAFLWSLFH
jgi:glycosyltransferase involved in cell wall biosynthesis